MLFCVIPNIAPHIEYIKIRVENFHIYLLIMQTYAKTVLYKFLSKFFVIVKDNCLPTFLERKY